MKSAKFTFHGNLNFFLHRRQKDKPVIQEFDWRGTIKDMIESIAPPHPEIELIVVNGESVNWDYIVQDGDIVDVYPNFDAVDLVNKVILLPPYQGKPKFILDTHLGRLAAYLRMMGFDTLYKNDYEDDVLAEVSASENRILLTRDIGVLKRGIVVYGYFVRETNPRRRFIEIARRYNLSSYSTAFGRCTRCNGTLNNVQKADILEELSDRTASHYDTFYQCVACHQVYWRGSHYYRMQELIQEVIHNT